MLRRLGLVVLLALPACTGGSEPPIAAPSPSTSAVASSPPSPLVAAPSSAAPSVPAAAVLLVAADPVGNAGVYALAPGSRRAVQVRDLASRGDWSIESVSMSAGPTPSTCAIWRSQAEPPQDSQLRCYAGGDSRGRVVEASSPLAVAVRADGRAVAWLEAEANSNTDVVVADLAADVVTVRSRARYVADLPPNGGIPEGVTDVAWLGPRTLGLTDVADSDEGKGLCVLDLDKPRGSKAVGFGPCLTPGAAETKAGYDRFEHAAALQAGTVLTVERGPHCCADEPGPPGRAVVVRLSDGAVLDVVATPAAGRAVVRVTGGPRALFYVTEAAGDMKRTAVYVRWPGEEHGAPVSGLLELTSEVAAQP